MSRILVLNRYRLHSAAFHRWVDPRHELFLLNCATRAVDEHPEAAAVRARYRDIAEFDDYIRNPAVFDTACEWIERHDIDAVVAFSEFDVLRAARLRAEYDLDGQRPDSAVAYRDKLVMKRLFEAAGLPIVPYAAVTGADDLTAFARNVGYPVVVKPRTETGSRGIVRLDDDEARATFVRDHYEHVADYLVEAYTPHTLLHCDGVVVDGTVVFAEAWSWSSTLLRVRDTAVPAVAVTLDDDDPRRQAVLGLTDRTLHALPSPSVMPFHVEFFDTSEGIVVNEAASRIGGGRIQPTLRRLHGVDLVELTVRHLTASAPESVTPRRTAATGGFLIVNDDGSVRGVAPAACPLPGISDYETVLPTSDAAPTDVAAASLLISGVAVGDSRGQTEQRLTDLHRWFLQSLVPV